MSLPEKQASGGSQGETATSSGSSSEAREPYSNVQKTRSQDWSTATEKQKAEGVADLLSGRKPAGEAEDPDAESGESPKTPENGSESGDPDPWVSDAGKSGEGAGGEGEVAPAPKTLAELAERLEIEPDELYKLEIKTGDGQSVALGALKDAYQAQQSETREIAKRAQALDERESALTADRIFVTKALKELGSTVPPEMQRQFAERRKREQEHEQTSLLAAMPELEDPTVLTGFKKSVGLQLQKYGWRSGEVEDHRTVLMARDLLRMNARLDKLLSFEPGQADPPDPGPARGKQGDNKGRLARLKQRAQSGNTSDQLAAVSAILKG